MTNAPIKAAVAISRSPPAQCSPANRISGQVPSRQMV